MLRYPRRMKMRVSDGLWVRLVDVGAALSARSYASDEQVVFEVDDPFLPDNSGRWRVAGGEASRTDDAADLALDVGELGAAYLGGFGFGELVRAGRVTELTDGAASRADAIFLSEPKPWCPEIF
jgi:predicted acetyltransferase